MVGDNKRKRGRKPKNLKSETLDFQTTTATTSTAAIDDGGVFSVGKVELVDDPSSNHLPRRRGRPRKTPQTAQKPDKTLVASPTRRIENGNAVAEGPLAAARWESAAMTKMAPSMDAVVKVFCVHSEPNFSLPWQRKRQYSSSSSGFVIAGRRVLTNAHSVEHFTQVKLKKRGSDTKYLARVLAIGTECDIGECFTI